MFAKLIPFTSILVMACAGLVCAGTVDLPKTGQTKCYDASGAMIACAGTGQDGELQKGAAWPNPRFTLGTGIEAACITDNLTGLMWPKDMALVYGTKQWSAALDQANTLTLCGYSDWRLPNVNELESLINANEPSTGTWLGTQGFLNVFGGYTWSATTLASDTGRAWAVSMTSGIVYYNSKTDYGFVFPVRAGGASGNATLWQSGQSVTYDTGDDGEYRKGAAWPSPRFTDSGGGEVTDALTGLIWTKDAKTPGPAACGPAEAKTWQDALGHVQCLNSQNYLGHNDWRLPNRREIRSLIDYSRYDPALPASAPFTDVQWESLYWSSTPSALLTYGAHYIVMRLGYEQYASTANTGFAWPVRDGQGGSSGTFFALNVSTSGTGSGTVSSNPAGISCGADCTESFASGTTVTLTAAPSTGSTFSSWSGACSGTNTTCTVTMEAAKNVAAVFSLNEIVPPTGSILINSGVEKTISASVTLTLSCTGNCIMMSFSNDAGANWTTPENYSMTKAWTLLPGHGVKTVSVWFGDGAGNWSPMYSDTIVLDTTVPIDDSTETSLQTGQKTCYSASGTSIDCTGTGQDGELQKGIAWPELRFTPGTGLEADCLTDNLTGLMWPKNGNLPGSAKTWNDAIDYANGLTWCGYSDWRLPNVNELESLVNAHAPITASWLNTQGFVDVQPYSHWSSTTNANDPGNAWFVNMWGGYVSYGNKTNNQSVLPVRTGHDGALGSAGVWRTGQTAAYRTGDDGEHENGVAWPSPRFVDRENGEVVDALTGLIWTKDAYAPGPAACSPKAGKKWQNALDFVKCLNTQNYLGHDNWRLPNRREIRSLVDYSRGNPYLPADHPFINVFFCRFWSSTTDAHDTGYAWRLDMYYGPLDGGIKGDGECVWPVRSGQAVYFTLNVAKTGTGAGMITSSPGGIDCGSDCAETLTSGTSVSLTAAADIGSTFSGWSGGGCQGTGPCTVALTADTTVTAEFTSRPAGDVNYDGYVDLADAVLALQVVAGISAPQIAHKEADLNRDGRIGLAEAIFVLQKVAQTR